MPPKGFTHLHLHSQYSLLDGAVTFDKLLKKCKRLNMDSVAVTDHGNLFGAVEFYSKAKKADIKPIIGIEAYLAPKSRFDKQKTSISNAAFHLVLLAQNNTGYKNLLKLSSIGYTEGFYYRPRIDMEVLEELNEGLIASTACIKGQIPSMLAKGDYKAAKKYAEKYAQIFSQDRFFIEIQKHENDDPELNKLLIQLADELGLPLVATNDVHFLEESDYEAHNCLCCISTNKKFDDPNRMIYPKDIFFKDAKQMRSDFADIPQACDNTLEIAKRCDVELDLKSHHAPSFQPPDKKSPEEFLTKLVFDNAEKVYDEITPEIKARIERELDVIESKGFASYFLIVWDFCNYARENNIPVGARGSAVGTVVGYCLGLCNIDPFKYDLLFERFMDPHRNEMPDVDIDICQESRPKMLEYVKGKYGHVAQIITFGTMKARAVIRDICRVLNVPLSEADRLAKLVPIAVGMTIERAMKTEPELKNSYQQNPQTKKVIDICQKLEGLARHASVHAAGVVISDKNLTDFLPLYKAAGSDDIITQFDGPTVEKVGLLKMDFLGLKTLSVLERAKNLVKKTHDVDIDLEKIPVDDPRVFKLFAEGRTKGIFQFESGGMRDLLVKIEPDRIEDLIAANALYRPGPMTLIPDYIDRKHGAKWNLPHPVMKEILAETYGIMVYQEQVMRICNRLGDIPLRQAYGLIKAISKKKAKTIAKAREKFIEGCRNKGLSELQATQIFELIKRFAGYGFNKSHSTRYAFVAYQTAYMKAYWPVEYMAALLTYDIDNTEKVVDYINECAQMGIEILPPDINESLHDFTPIYKQKEQKQKGIIRFGLAAVKGAGDKAVKGIIEKREKIGKFKSLFHFCENVELGKVNKQTIESLVKAGAFDKLGGSRAQMIAGLEKAMKIGSHSQADRQNGQLNFFAETVDTDYSKDHEKLPQIDPWPELKMLALEKEVLGFYVTSNPLSRYAETINLYSTANTSDLEKYQQDKKIVIGGMITKIRIHLTQRGKAAGAKMAVLTLEDLQGQAEVVLFPDKYNQFNDFLETDKVLFVKGRLDYRRERPNIIAAELIPIEQITEKHQPKVSIKINAEDVTKEKIAEIKAVCSHHKGQSPLYVSVSTSRGKVYARADENLAVRADLEFCRKIKNIVGEKNLKLST